VEKILAIFFFIFFRVHFGPEDQKHLLYIQDNVPRHGETQIESMQIMENILSGNKRTIKETVLFLASGLIALFFALTMMNSHLYFYLIVLISYLLMLFFMGVKGLHLGYLVMVFTLPFVLFIPRSLIGDQLYLQYHFRLALYLGMLLLWGALFIRKKISIDLTNNKVIFILLFFFMMELASLLYFRGINIPNFRDSFVFQDIRDQSMSLILFLLTVSLCKSKANIERVLYVVAASSPIVIGIGFFEKLSNYALFSPRQPYFQEITQITSTFWDPNHLSRYLVILILLYLPFYLFSASSGLWRLVISLLAFILLSFTGSVSGFASLMVGVMLILFNRKYFIQMGKGANDTRKYVLLRGFIWFALILLFAVVGSWVFSQFSIYSDIILGKLSMIEGSARHNLDLAALQMFAKHPLFGVGFSNYSVLFSSFNPGLNLWALGGTPIIHNSFMSVASELGVAGLILLFVIYIYFGKIALMDGKNIQDDLLRRTQISLGAIWITLIVNSFVYFKFFEDPKVWLVAGLIIAINGVHIDQQELNREEICAQNS